MFWKMKKRHAEHKKLPTTWCTRKVSQKKLVGGKNCGDSVRKSVYRSRRKSRDFWLLDVKVARSLLPVFVLDRNTGELYRCRLKILSTKLQV